jgi:hypothetical protein
MKARSQLTDESTPKIDIIKGSFHNPQKAEQSRQDDLKELEQERRSKLN